MGKRAVLQISATLRTRIKNGSDLGCLEAGKIWREYVPRLFEVELSKVLTNTSMKAMKETELGGTCLT